MFMLNTGSAQALASLDVCKVPTPAGTVPMPLVNIANTQMAASNSVVSHVLVVNRPALNQKSQINQSNGDEAGTAGGVVSGKFIHKTQFLNGSLKVMVGGKPAVRMGVMTGQNGTPQNAVGSVLSPSQSKVSIGG